MTAHESEQDSQIIKALLEGRSLRTYMVPDDRIPTNFPEHIESYALPHVLIHGDQFWGKSDNTHMPTGAEKVSLSPAAFYYTSIGEMFASYTPAISTGIFMSKKRYRIHQWVLVDDYSLIWDSENPEDVSPIKASIEKAAQFRIALLDSDNIWNIHPVDLPMYYTESQRFSLKVAFDVYPGAFRNFQQLNQFYAEHQSFFESLPSDNSVGCQSFNADNHNVFFDISSCGEYQHYYDLERKVIRRYQRLKVYADVRF